MDWYHIGYILWFIWYWVHGALGKKYTSVFWYYPLVVTIICRREWQSTPVFLPGEFHGQRNLAGYSPWGHRELDTTGRWTHTHTHTHTVIIIESLVAYVVSKISNAYLQPTAANQMVSLSLEKQKQDIQWDKQQKQFTYGSDIINWEEQFNPHSDWDWS